MKKKDEKLMSAEEFDAKFDSGEDILQYFDLNTAVKKINVDFPLWMVKILDAESKKLGIPRQAVIKTWLNEKIESNKRAERRAVG